MALLAQALAPRKSGGHQADPGPRAPDAKRRRSDIKRQEKRGGD